MGKLSMKDIMGLFRREAEHTHHGDVGLGLGEKTRVLGAQMGGGVRGVEERERVGKRASPPVLERQRARDAAREESVFSRRW